MFKIHFTDTIGNQDSLVLGYDPLASYGIDDQFGEIDIASQSFDSIFEVRAAAYNYDLNPLCDYWREELWDFESKTFITVYDCASGTGLWQEGYSIGILIKAKHLPVTASWDNSLFNETCRENSLLVNWTPGGWFDACCCFGSAGYVSLKEQSTYLFENTDVQAIKGVDTLFSLFIPIDDLISGNHVIETNSLFNIFPNPSQGYLYFNSDVLAPNNQYHELIIYDALGTILKTEKIYDRYLLDLTNYHKGVYFYNILKNRRSLQSGRIVNQ